MYQWVKKIHTYAGLLSFTALVVWGLAGIHGAFLPAPGSRSPEDVSEERIIPYEAPGHLDDQELALEVFKVADIPMSNAPFNVHRNESHDLAFVTYTVNGRHDVVYLEDEQQILIRIRRNSLLAFIASIHTGHSRRGAPDLPARLWGYYNELSTWAFLFMALSGVYLWLATRQHIRWTRILAGSAATIFLVLWLITR